MKTLATPRKIIRRIGCYSQDNEGTWYVRNDQRGLLPVDPRESRSLRFDLIANLRRRYMRKLIVANFLGR